MQSIKHTLKQPHLNPIKRTPNVERAKVPSPPTSHLTTLYVHQGQNGQIFTSSSSLPHLVHLCAHVPLISQGSYHLMLDSTLKLGRTFDPVAGLSSCQ